jgi:hypothetical protein
MLGKQCYTENGFFCESQNNNLNTRVTTNILRNAKVNKEGCH